MRIDYHPELNEQYPKERKIHPYSYALSYLILAISILFAVFSGKLTEKWKLNYFEHNRIPIRHNLSAYIENKDYSQKDWLDNYL